MILRDFQTLKPGDPVAYFISRHMEPNRCVVEKVTPSGRVKLDNGAEFNADGTIRGRDTFNRAYLEVWTDDIKERIRKADLVRAMETRGNARRWTELSLDQLERIAAIIAEKKEA